MASRPGDSTMRKLLADGAPPAPVLNAEAPMDLPMRVDCCAWQAGPMPPDTWYWGGVVTKSIINQGGFFFADFRGDHVIIYPDEKKVLADEIAFYNNCIGLPPQDKEKTNGS